MATMSEARLRQAVLLRGQARATSRWKPWERARLLESALGWALGETDDEEELVMIAPPEETPREGRTLYQRLRGRCGAEVVNGIVMKMYDRIYADETLSGFFRHVDRAKLEKKMVQVLTAILDHSNWSPEALAGHHKNYAIQNKHFNAVVGHAVAAMQDQQVPQSYIDEIGEAVLTLRGVIVNTPDDAVTVQ